MNGRLRPFLLAALGLGAAALLLVLLAPSLLSALPSQVRGRLPEEIIRALTTPLPTALPAPLNAAAATPISISELLPPTASHATASPTPLPAASATETPSPESTTADPTRRPAATATEPPQGYCPYPAGGCEVRDPDRSRFNTLPLALTPETFPPTATPTATPLPPLMQHVDITGLEIVPQKFNNCGSANMSVVLNYYGAEDTQTDIANRIKPHYDDRNVSPEELVAYVNEETGLKAAVFRGGDIKMLRRLLGAGFPVIIEKGYEPDAWQGWMGHYLTLIGFDNPEQEFNTLDTYLGPWDSSGRPASYEEVEFRWAQFNNAFIVVYRPFEEEELLALLGPAYTDPATMWQNAATAAEAVVEKNPDDAFAWFNLGASLTELARLNGDEALYSAAASAFDQSRLVGLPPRMMWYQFEPYDAYIESGRIDEALALASAVMQSDGGWHVEESHFYQGLAYEADGRFDLARAAFKRALDIKPNYPLAQEHLDNL
ncbi:MAG: C39 family peptidase [Candidatus Promineifilaceae bacterium]